MNAFRTLTHNFSSIIPTFLPKSAMFLFIHFAFLKNIYGYIFSVTCIRYLVFDSAFIYGRSQYLMYCKN